MLSHWRKCPGGPDGRNFSRSTVAQWSKSTWSKIFGAGQQDRAGGSDYDTVPQGWKARPEFSRLAMGDSVVKG